MCSTYVVAFLILKFSYLFLACMKIKDGAWRQVGFLLASHLAVNSLVFASQRILKESLGNLNNFFDVDTYF